MGGCHTFVKLISNSFIAELVRCNLRRNDAASRTTSWCSFCKLASISPVCAAVPSHRLACASADRCCSSAALACAMASAVAWNASAMRAFSWCHSAHRRTKKRNTHEHGLARSGSGKGVPGTHQQAHDAPMDARSTPCGTRHHVPMTRFVTQASTEARAIAPVPGVAGR